MPYFIDLELKKVNANQRRYLQKWLIEWPHSGVFEEEGEKIHVYFQPLNFHPEIVKAQLNTAFINYKFQMKAFTLDPNLDYNGFYQPVLVDDFVLLKLPIHPKLSHPVKHKLWLVPNLSFGMGHHLTTQLMLKQMKEIPFKAKNVLDLGTGSGVLAIIAARERAKKVYAFDIDSSAVQNTHENAVLNQVDIYIQKGSMEDFIELKQRVDILLANINIAIHEQFLCHYNQVVERQGYILLSGILQQDVSVLDELSKQLGWKKVGVVIEGGWSSVLYQKLR